MSTKHAWRRTAVGAVLTAVALTATATTATATTHARSAAAPAGHRAATAPVAVTSTAVARIEDRTARDLARSLSYGSWRTQLRTATAASGEVDLQALTARTATAAGGRLAAAVAAADQGIAAAKGLPAGTGSLLRVHLGDASMGKALDAGAAPLVAAAPADEHALTITAYDSRGAAHVLDATGVPAQPVYLVDLDVSKALTAGLGVLRQELAAQGLSAPVAHTTAATGAGWWATKITSIRVSDDQEPWIKGSAEMFSLVTGFGWDGKVRVDSVDMPYLDNDGTTYYPNQILVNWSNYKYNLADVVLMEDDGDTNYLSLAKALAGALLTITDQGTYIPLVNALLDAMPSSWWTDDPDYVDSWYTLAQSNSGTLYGAAANGWMTVQPYYVQGF